MKQKRIRDIADIKNHTADTIEAVHGWSFVIFEIVVYVMLDRIVLSKYLPDSIWGEIIRALAFAAGYWGIFLVVKWIFNSFIINWRRPLLNIGNKEPWYHVHIPDASLAHTQHIEYLSAGTTLISRSLNDYTFKAENYRYTINSAGEVQKRDREPSTTWCTETSELCEGNEIHIVEVYKASSECNTTAEIHQCPVCRRNYGAARIIEEAPQKRYGIHLYTIRNSNEIVATYSDCWPSLKSGKLYLFRNKSDRDEKIKSFFKEQQANPVH